MGVEKDTRTCKLCRQEKDKKKHFYSPTDDVCIACNGDWVTLKNARKLGREEGPAALQERIRKHIRLARINREALRSITIKEK